VAVGRRKATGVRLGRLRLESRPKSFLSGRITRRDLAIVSLAVLGLAVTVGIITVVQNRTAATPAIAPPYAAHNLTPIASNQWYSDVLAQFPTQPLYALPGAYQLSPQGFGVSVPVVKKSADSIQAPYRTDLLLAFDGPLGKPKITEIGDWSVSLSMTSARGTEIHFTLAHGVPFTVLHSGGSSLSATCAQACAAFVDNIAPIRKGAPVTAKALSLTVGASSYVLVFDRMASVRFDGKTVQFDRVGRAFLGILDTRSHYQMFKDIADTELLGTQATAQVSGAELRTTYNLISTGPTPLLALYPHQVQALEHPLPVLGSYPTIRGMLSLVRAKSFITILAVQRPPIAFPPLSVVPDDLGIALSNDIHTYIQTGPPSSGDYFLGVWLGRGIDLLQLAQSTGMAAGSQQLVRYLEPILASSLKGFYYDPGVTSVVARRPEFGNERLNDHHFQYGYFIRAAAVLSEVDPHYLAQVRESVSAMVADVANSNRSSAQYPYLRTFDVYEGHSWADGFARFADGNNEESSSEAIDAWYAVYLWSRATNDARLEVTGLYLYTTEVQSVKQYWFGANGLYSAPYQHRIASQVWGGKVDFATWFSNNPSAIYGIQLLPITPASAYLGQLSSIDSYLIDLRTSGATTTGYWADLLLIWESYYNPRAALEGARSVRTSDLNGPRSLLLYMVYRGAQAHP
jgi:hypothetical protein